MLTIGIVGRIDKTENNDVYVFNKPLTDYFLNNNIKIIPLISYDTNSVKKCNGFILPGGDYKTIDFLIIKYAYENNIPLLGICLGMQSIGEYFNGKLKKANKHYSKDKYVHEIKIDKTSKLFDILKINNINVNSRHNEQLIEPNIKVSALSIDGTIEAIEDKNKKFFIGIQWHPETIISYDEYAKKILDVFIESCKEE